MRPWLLRVESCPRGVCCRLVVVRLTAPVRCGGNVSARPHMAAHRLEERLFFINQAARGQDTEPGAWREKRPLYTRTARRATAPAPPATLSDQPRALQSDCIAARGVMHDSMAGHSHARRCELLVSSDDLVEFFEDGVKLLVAGALPMTHGELAVDQLVASLHLEGARPTGIREFGDLHLVLELLLEKGFERGCRLLERASSAAVLDRDGQHVSSKEQARGRAAL
mmetsp:Transcript_20115/g.57655  ORF Transcript_20115/g.57655 Transcript_20115/m.57655 type:complete len:225 (-) Transcript_20115:13-687(-)